jgi:hypothetical protein
LSTPQLFPGYCIDTSALIDLWRRLYPPDIFPSLWKEIDKLYAQGELIAPREVLKELEQKDDELLKWASKHRKMFKKLDYDQVNKVRNILSRFQNLVDVNKTIPEADPFVIALALSKGWTLITSEKLGSSGHPKIPDVCTHYGVKCINLIEFFREQKWEF